MAKRLLDLTGSLLGLCMISPLLLLIAGAIKFEDGGPIFFRQIRIGHGGREFSFYKFRSMSVDAERQREELRSEQGHHSLRFKMKSDPRVTRTGRWLRRFSLDEVPQLWNVLRGEMSLVGPRPALPEEVRNYDSYQHRRLAVAPGVTCTWQVEGRSDVPFEQQVEMDLAYIAARSLALDAKLLARTLPAVLSGRGAY